MKQRGELSRIFTVFTENFYVNIGGGMGLDASEASSAAWNLGTNLTFRLVPENTTKKVGLIGLPDTN
jgi:hypothetical protein